MKVRINSADKLIEATYGLGWMATNTALAPHRIEIPFPLIAVGFSSSENSQQLARFLRILGFDLHQQDALSGLDVVLDTHRKTTMLVYSPVGSSVAADVVEMLEAAYRSPPLIVVTDRVDMGQYHEPNGSRHRRLLCGVRR